MSTVKSYLCTEKFIMNSIVLVVFACLAAANAGIVVAPGSSRIIQAPSSRTTIAGPDGSLISSEQPGGAIVENDSAAVIAKTVPLVASTPLAYSAPVLATAPAALTYSAPIAYSAHGSNIVHSYAATSLLSSPVAYSGIVAEKQLDTIVAGPSGTIATSKTLHHPTLVAAPEVYAAGVRYVL